MNSAVFYRDDQPIKLSACSYLHNYSLVPNDVLLDQRFEKAIEQVPLFTAGEEMALAASIADKVGAGNGMTVLNEIEASELKPSQKVLDKVSTSIKQKLHGKLKLFGRCKAKEDYILLDE